MCGTTYGSFRSPLTPTFVDAYEEMLAESRALVTENGDYSKPASRRAVLGRMHGRKQGAWKDHVRECLHYARCAEALPF